MENLIGKHFVLTGGTSGLGYALTEALLKKGAHVTLLVRDIQKFNSLKFKHNQVHLKMKFCDLSSIKTIHQLTFQNKIDGLIHSAGLAHFKSISDHTEQEMLETYNINLIHFNILLKQLEPYFNKHAVIIGISSLAAFSTQINSGHYAASKAGFNQVLNTYRLEHPNFHVMIVNAGPIKTPFHQKADPTLKYAKKIQNIILDPKQLAEKIITSMQKGKVELNTPNWLFQAQKIYQLNPRMIERIFPFLFNNKKE